MKRTTISAIITFLLVGSWPVYAAMPDGPTQSKTFSVNKGGTLDVSINGGDIHIATWEKNEVAIKVQFEDEDAEEDLKMTQNGNTVRIVDNGGWGETDNRYDISVPAKFNLEMRTGSGDLIISGKLEGTIDGQTSGGSIRMDDVTGKVDVSTSGGDIRAGRITGDGRFNTSGGDIDVQGTSGDLDVKTSGGDIRLGNVGKTLRASTSGGNVTIGDVGNEAEVSTSGGNIRVGKVNGRVRLKTSGGDVELSSGTGSILAYTSGGNVRLSNIAGSIDARTAGGDIDAELTPDGKGTSKLASASGEIRFFVPENARATIDAVIRIHGGWHSSRDSYDIQSDFKAETKESDRDSREIRARYILNGGGQSISLETVNSDITIRKMKK